MNKRLLIRLVLASRAFFLIIMVNIFLQFMSFKNLLKLIKPSHRALFSGSTTEEEIYKVTYKVLYTSISGFQIFRPTCLRKSIVLFRIFRIYGYPVKLELGVRRNQGSVEAHSWLTLEQQPLFENEEVLKDYELLFSFE